MNKPMIIAAVMLGILIIAAIIYSSNGPTASIVTFDPAVTPTPTFIPIPKNLTNDAADTDDIQAPDILINTTVEPLPAIDGIGSKSQPPQQLPRKPAP